MVDSAFSSSGKLSLIVFFTRGVSLKIWDEVGMFAREVALYKRLQQVGVKVSFVTYGDKADQQFADRIPGIEICCNHWGIPARIYEKILPLLHGRVLSGASLFKTNQTDGADIALMAARIWRKPLVARCGYMWSDFSARIFGPQSPIFKRARRLEKKIFPRASRVVVTTEAMRQDIAERFPSAAEHTVVLPNYVDTDGFRPEKVDRDGKTLIFVGRLSPQKNLEALLQAIEPLAVKLLLIGEGELKNDLQSHYGNLNGRVSWLGNIPNDKLPSFLNRASLFVLPSYYEGHPKVLIEAMACGLPVLGTNVPGIREIVSHGETGWLCEPDADALRKGIQEVLADFELQEKLGRKARKYAVENFALNLVAEREIRLYRETLGYGGRK